MMGESPPSLLKRDSREIFNVDGLLLLRVKYMQMLIYAPEKIPFLLRTIMEIPVHTYFAHLLSAEVPQEFIRPRPR